VVTIPGTRRRAHLEENLAAAGIKLSAEDLARLDRELPLGAGAGARYQESQMGTVNV